MEEQLLTWLEKKYLPFNLRGENDMPLVLFEKESETRARINVIHYTLEDLPQETIDLGVEVEQIPEPEQFDGKEWTMLFNPHTKDIWYEYRDRPLTPDEKLKIANQEISMMKSVLDELILSGSGF